ncbi:branched-chain amino acid ABC transporter substrate-binding protein [Patulibacter minatonensis]|uniref:branched-chain amino acid ABC transporter substrate-binding protein n=1 Tax=Patulibacter minatonensis TaxID=298163 RepID=UPI00047C0CB3|nr:branched-chain amino acid ABC transporter substrate-binding protein [Patulibacter minatonensis]
MVSTARARVAATTIGAGLCAALLTTAAGAASPAASGSPSTTSDAPVSRVYVSLPRQGKAAPSAALIARGLRVATAARGGTAGGRRIKLVWLDDATGDRFDPAKVVANAERAAADPTAIAYVGEGNSEATALSMPIVNRAGLAQLSPVSTATSLTSDARAAELQPTGVRTFFRPLPDDARQGTALVSYAKAEGVTGDVLLVDDDGLYGRGLTSAFAEAGARNGVRTTGRLVVTPDGGGLEALVAAVRAQRPTAMVYGGSPSSGAAKVLRAVHRASPGTRIFGGEALANDAFARDLGPAQSAMRVTAPAAHADPRPGRTHGLGRRPAAFTVFAHNGMTALLRAVDRSARTGAVTRESVRTAVFDGTPQTGLSGAWTITASGDSTYGVYDALRLSRGHVQTPGALATAALLKKERRALRAERARLVRKQRRLGRTGSAPRTAQISSSSGLNASTIQSMDLETAMMMIQGERAKLLDQQLQTKIQEVQDRNARVAKLQAVLKRLTAFEALFPAGADAERSTATTTDAATLATMRQALATEATAAGLTPIPDTSTRGSIIGASTTVKSQVDSASNSQQMDMLRLQSLANKRNEAFDNMTNYLKKMQESRSSIIGNMR